MLQRAFTKPDAERRHSRGRGLESLCFLVNVVALKTVPIFVPTHPQNGA